MPNTNHQPTCADLVSSAMESRIDDLHLMTNPSRDDVTIRDDGTLDTVLCLGDDEFRFADTSAYRIPDLDLDALLDDEFDAMADTMRERFYEYGLSFDYVAPGTFTDQNQGYFRYQISWGGPSEEFRFFVNPDFSCYRIEFWYLDWHDGASVTLADDDESLLMQIFDDFRDCGTVEHVYREATA